MAWQQSEAQSAAAEQLSPYRAGLWQGEKTAINGNMHTVVQTRCLTSVNDAGDSGISAVRTRSASHNLKFKVKLTASKIPNPAVAF